MAKSYVYPNPASNWLHIDSKNAASYTISVSNGLGTALIIERSNDAHTQIDITSLTPGMYYVKIQSDDGSVMQVEKIIKI